LEKKRSGLLERRPDGQSSFNIGKRRPDCLTWNSKLSEGEGQMARCKWRVHYWKNRRPDGQTKMVSELLEREGQVARGKW